MGSGDRLVGPAIIEERESTFVVGSGARVHVDEFGSLVVEPPQDARAAAGTTATTEAV